MLKENSFTDTSVKRRERSGRTPWRRIYSCIEPSSLLYANSQDQERNAKFSDFHFETTREDQSELKNNSDQSKQSARMNSTRHITLAGEWSDVKTLKNRDVSVNFSYPGKVLDLDYILDPQSQSFGMQHRFAQKRKTASDLKAARRRRHTVSRIEYKSPFLPISEANEEKAIATGGDEIRSDSARVEQTSCDSYSNQSTRPRNTVVSEEDSRSSPLDDDEDLGFYGRYSRTDFLKNQAKDKYRTVDDLTKLGQVEMDRDVLKKEDNETSTKGSDKGSKSSGESNETKVESQQADDQDSEACLPEGQAETSCHDQSQIDDEIASVAGRSLTAKGNSEPHSCEDDVQVVLSEIISKLEASSDHVPAASVEEIAQDNGGDSIERLCTTDKFARRVSEPVISSPIPHMRRKRKAKPKCIPSKDGTDAEATGDIIKRLYRLVITSVCKTSTRLPVISDLLVFLQSQGIWLSDHRLKKTLLLVQEYPQKDQTELLEEVFTRICSPTTDLIRNVLLSQMMVPGFSTFASKMEKVFFALQSTVAKIESNECGRKDSSVDPSSNFIDFMLSRRSAKEKSISLSVCTVDGQRLRFGDTESFHPLDACANVLNYCIACRQNGVEVMKSHIGKTPVTDFKDEYTFDERGRVLNPFTKAGAITTSALLSQKETVENRISQLHDVYSKTMAGEPLCCDNLSYNLKRIYAHEEISLAYYLSARHKLPKMYNATPGDILELHFQSTSTATTSDACSVAAATLAADGTCPFTGETVFKSDIVRHVVKKMRDTRCQDEIGKLNNSMSFVWSESGSVLVVVPGVFGLACFVQSQPRIAVQEIVTCLVQTLDSIFSFSVYRNLKREDDVSRVSRK